MSIIDGGDAFSTFDPVTGGYGPATRTVADVVRALKRTFGDESGVQIEDADILMWINDAQDEIVKRNKILKAASTATSIINQASYQFPTEDILQIESLHFDEMKLQNMPFAQAEQDFINKDTPTEYGTPILWWEWGGVFTLYPAPNQMLEIKLYYTKKPVRITSVIDLLSVPDKYYKQVVDYAMQQAYEMDEEPELSQMKGQQFETGLDNMAEEERTAQQMTYPTITILD